MPTKNTYPVNMSKSINNYVRSRTGANWNTYELLADRTSNDTPDISGFVVYPKKYSVASNIRPFFNKQNGSSYESSTKFSYIGSGDSSYSDYVTNGDANAFRSRPIKHWRIQYGNIDGKQSYSNRYLINTIDRPGGTRVSTNDDTIGIDKICSDTGCEANVGKLNNEVGKLNKTGKYNPIYFKSNIEPYMDLSDNYYDSLDINQLSDATVCYSIKKCIDICDAPTNAIKKVRSGGRIIQNGGLCNNRYFINSSDYLRSRCKTFKQNNFHFKPKDEYQTEGTAACDCNYPNCQACYAKAGYNSIKFKSNCPSVCGTSGSGSTCSTTYYKPNNVQYAQQGAVDSSSRLTRLKLNTINSNANSIGKNYGRSSANALSYSGRVEAPFINKEKMNAGGYAVLKSKGKGIKFPRDNNLLYIYKPGGGNNVTACMNDVNNNRIIGPHCATSVFPRTPQTVEEAGFGGANFFFTERQSKKIGVGSSKGRGGRPPKPTP